MMKTHLPNEAAMLTLGQAIAHAFPENGVILLKGELGTGKTTLVKTVLRSLGHQGAVKSPTYTLVEPYHLQGRDIYHFDLYRLGDPEELEFIGIRDYFHEHALCLIEWPERAIGYLPQEDMVIHLSYCGQGRNVELECDNNIKQVVTGCSANFT